MFHNVSKVFLCDRHNTFASLSEDDFHFLWQAQLWRPPSSCGMAGAVFFAYRIVKAASSEDNVQIPLQAWHFVTCDDN